MKLEELVRDEQFMVQISTCEGFGEMVNLLAAKGISISEDELKSLWEQFKEETTLDEVALDEVAGGCLNPFKSMDMYNAGCSDYGSGRKNGWNYFFHGCYRRGWRDARNLDSMLR